MGRAERLGSSIEPLAEITEFPVGVSASRSIRDYETPSVSHAFSSGFRSSGDGVV